MAVFTTSRMSFLKLLQLILTCACIGLHYHSLHYRDVYEQFLVTGTFVGYLIILVGVYAGYIFSMPISKRIDIFYSVCGCALYVASGALTIQTFESWKTDSRTSDIGMAKGSLAIINGLLFIIDAFVSFRTE